MDQNPLNPENKPTTTPLTFQLGTPPAVPATPVIQAAPITPTPHVTPIATPVQSIVTPISSTPISQIPTTTTSAPKKNLKLIGGIVATVAVVAIGGFAYFKFAKTPTESPVAEVAQAPSEVAQVETPAVETQIVEPPVATAPITETPQAEQIPAENAEILTNTQAGTSSEVSSSTAEPLIASATPEVAEGNIGGTATVPTATETPTDEKPVETPADTPRDAPAETPAPADDENVIDLSAPTDVNAGSLPVSETPTPEETATPENVIAPESPASEVAPEPPATETPTNEFATSQPATKTAADTKKRAAAADEPTPYGTFIQGRTGPEILLYPLFITAANGLYYLGRKKRRL